MSPVNRIVSKNGSDDIIVRAKRAPPTHYVSHRDLNIHGTGGTYGGVTRGQGLVLKYSRRQYKVSVPSKKKHCPTAYQCF